MLSSPLVYSTLTHPQVSIHSQSVNDLKVSCYYSAVVFSENTRAVFVLPFRLSVTVLIACFVFFSRFFFSNRKRFCKFSFNSYLRSQKPYTPPSDVSAQINSILASSNVTDRSTKLEMLEKFNILKAFDDAFKHSVPNSQLHEIVSVGKSFNEPYKRASEC